MLLHTAPRASSCWGRLRRVARVHKNLPVQRRSPTAVGRRLQNCTPSVQRAANSLRTVGLLCLRCASVMDNELDGIARPPYRFSTFCPSIHRNVLLTLGDDDMKNMVSYRYSSTPEPGLFQPERQDFYQNGAQMISPDLLRVLVGTDSCSPRSIARVRLRLKRSWRSEKILSLLRLRSHFLIRLRHSNFIILFLVPTSPAIPLVPRLIPSAIVLESSSNLRRNRG